MPVRVCTALGSHDYRPTIKVMKNTPSFTWTFLQVAFPFDLDIDFSTLPMSEDVGPYLVLVKDKGLKKTMNKR